MHNQTEKGSAEVGLQLARRREINRKAARKSRSKEKERANNVRQMYLEAQSTNTMLNYQKKQLEKKRDALFVQWKDHEAVCQRPPRSYLPDSIARTPMHGEKPESSTFRRFLSAPESTANHIDRLPSSSGSLAHQPSPEKSLCQQLVNVEADGTHGSSDETGNAGILRSHSCPANRSSTLSSLPSAVAACDSDINDAASVGSSELDSSSQSYDSNGSMSSSSRPTELNDDGYNGGAFSRLIELDGDVLAAASTSSNGEQYAVGASVMGIAIATVPLTLPNTNNQTSTSTGRYFRSDEYAFPTNLLMTSHDDSFASASISVSDPAAPAPTDANGGGEGLGCETERFNDDHSNLVAAASSLQTSIEYNDLHATRDCPLADHDHREVDFHSTFGGSPDASQQVAESQAEYYDDLIPLHVRSMMCDK